MNVSTHLAKMSLSLRQLLCEPRAELRAPEALHNGTARVTGAPGLQQSYIAPQPAGRNRK